MKGIHKDGGGFELFRIEEVFAGTGPWLTLLGDNTASFSNVDAGTGDAKC
jgi:hypothetical protein